MTLALASVAPSFVVVTVDGRCTIRTAGAAAISDDYQKLVPVPGSRLVLYHYGQNQIVGRDWKLLVTPLFTALLKHDVTVAAASNWLGDRLDADVTAQLESMGPGHQAGFVLAGFGRLDKHPSAHEVLWRRTPAGVDREVSSTLPTGVRTSGDGANLIAQRHWQEIVGKSTDQVRALHQHHMTTAMAAADPSSGPVGGHVHEMVIKAVPTWTRPPKP